MPGISNSEGAGASYSQGEFYLATSNGFQGGYKSSTNSISCSVLAGEGQSMERDYDYSVSRHFSDLRSAKEIGTSAANKTLKRLNPKKITSTKLPVIFDKRISNGLIGYLAGAISGPSIARGTSFLKDSLGKQIFKKDVTIIGVLNKIEIWNPNLLRKVDQSDEVDDQSYEQLSERVNI